jgi:hypothetical protein
MTPLDAAHAHEFGRDLSQTEVAELNRRVLAELSENLELLLRQAARRFVQDTLAAALPGVYLRRAEEFERVGNPAGDDAARACRRHAWLLAQGLPHDMAAEVDEWLSSEVVR